MVEEIGWQDGCYFVVGAAPFRWCALSSASRSQAMPPPSKNKIRLKELARRHLSGVGITFSCFLIWPGVAGVSGAVAGAPPQPST